MARRNTSNLDARTKAFAKKHGIKIPGSFPVKEPELFITKAELAVRWKVSTKTIEIWVREGRCPAPVRLSLRRVRWKMSSVRAHERRFEEL